MPKPVQTKSLVKILKAWKKKKILVIGDVGVDRYTIGAVERISPEAPVPIVRVESERHKLGLAANVADNVVALGGRPLLTGVIGKDRSANDFKKLLKEASIESNYLVVDPTRRTVMKERIVSDKQQLLRVDYESSHEMSGRSAQALQDSIEKLIPKCDAVILEDYAKGMIQRPLAEFIFDVAAQNSKIVAVDPNVRTPIQMYRGAYVLTPNTKEAQALTGVRIKDLASLKEAGQRLLHETGAEYIVITRGKDGMATFSKGSLEVHLQPTYAREVFDVSGAGDTVIAVLTLSLAAGASINEAAILGNLAAGVEVGKRGTATVSPEELNQAIAEFVK